MTVKMTTVAMMVLAAGGGIEWVVLDALEHPNFAPLQFLNGARTAQENAPLFQKPLKENGAGAPLLHSAPLPSREWRNTSPSGEFRSPPKTAQEELEEARGAIAFHASELADLDYELAPVRIQEREIRESILATHGQSRHGVVILDLVDRRERRGLFGQLDEIAKTWGAKKELRRRINAQIKSLERQIQKFELIISKQSKRRA